MRSSATSSSTGRLTQKPLIDDLAGKAGKEPNADLRPKLLVLKGLLAFNGSDYVTELKNYTPPVIPPPAKEPAPIARSRSEWKVRSIPCPICLVANYCDP